MNLILYNLIFLVCFLPACVFIFPIKNDLAYIIFGILVIGIILHNLINKYVSSKILLRIYLALVFTFGIDNSL